MTNQSLKSLHINKRSIVFILLLSFVVLSSRGFIAQSAGDKKAGRVPVPKGIPRTIYDRGIKETVWEAPEELMVFFDARSKVDRSKADKLIKGTLGKDARIARQNAFAALVKGPVDINDRKNNQKLKNRQEITGVSPVYYSGDHKEQNRLALTGVVIVHFYLPQDDRSLKELARKHRLVPAGKPDFADNIYYFKTETAVESLEAANELQLLDQVKFAYPNWYKTMSKRAVPNDPLYADQWHLKNTGQNWGNIGNDVNIESVWDTNKGTSNEVIAVVDDGVDIAHEDLSANMLNAYNWDWLGNDSNPSPAAGDDHGTAVAGVAAARGFNAIGVSGAAPEAAIIGYRLLGAETDTNQANALVRNKGIVDISSNSWGPPDGGQTLERPGALAEAALLDGVTTGRQGKGIIYVWAGGNGGNADNSNYDGYANSRFTIGVGASNNFGQHSSYSEKGANILINAPSNGGSLGITTTDISGVLGYSGTNYENDFGGTSSATPLVSGVIALMLKANPELTWRDVQQILIQSAYKIDPTHSDWTTNGAGYPVNHYYGFGRIDAQAAVNLAAGWSNVGPEVSVQHGSNPNIAIPDNNSTGVSSTIEIPANIKIQHVDINFSASNHSYWGDLEISLESPAGTVSVLSEEHDSGLLAPSFDNWRFGSVRHFGESSQGQWRLTVKDLAIGDTGTFQSWQLKIYGTELNTGADTTPPTTSVSVTPSEHDGQPGWYKTKPTISLARDEAGLTSYSWNNSSGPWTIYEDPLIAPEGINTLYYYSSDPSGNTEIQKYQTFKVDSEKPVSSFTAPAYSTTSSTNNSFNISWSQTDQKPASGVGGYDIEYKVGTNGNWIRLKSDTLSTNLTVTGYSGSTYYFRSRAKDNAGNIGSWSPVKATIVPLDQSAFQFSTGWKSLTHSKLYKTGSRYSISAGSSASYTFSKALNVGLLATKRANAGYADVYIGSTKVKTINLYSASTKYRVPILIKSYTTARSGTLKVVVKGTKSSSSSGTRVELDGVFIKK